MALKNVFMLGVVKMRKKMMLDKSYFKTIRTRTDFEQADRSDWGSKKWGLSFPSSWQEHCDLRSQFAKSERKQNKRDVSYLER